MSQRGLLLILSSPSGAGKSTLAKRLIAKNESAQFSVSATTRDARTSRGQDSAETVERRMSQARSEISHWPEYDYVLINENLDQCEAELDQIIAAERALFNLILFR